jgi:hypothetical protein
MNTPSQKFLEKLGLKDPSAEPVQLVGSENDRRSFLKKAGLGGIMLGGFMFSSIEDTLAQSTSKVNRASAPTDLKITDMRYAVVMNGHARCPVIRIDTNQGIYGLGEVRDGASWRYAMFLKSRILGMNPCSVEMIFKRIKQFGFHARQGGGVWKWHCGILRVRHIMFPRINCWEESIATKFACMPTHRKAAMKQSLHRPLTVV